MPVGCILVHCGGAKNPCQARECKNVFLHIAWLFIFSSSWIAEVELTLKAWCSTRIASIDQKLEAVLYFVG